MTLLINKIKVTTKVLVDTNNSRDDVLLNNIEIISISIKYEKGGIFNEYTTNIRDMYNEYK
jgi:hypothetical protein